MPDFPPNCDAICQKILLNSDNSSGLVSALQPLVRANANKLSDEDKKKVVKILNRVESDLCEVQTLILRGAGYDGEVGKINS